MLITIQLIKLELFENITVAKNSCQVGIIQSIHKAVLSIMLEPSGLAGNRSLSIIFAEVLLPAP